MKLLIATTLFSSMAMNAQAADHQNCSFQFKDDLFIDQTEVRLQQADHTLWRINQQGELWIKGQAVTTDANTKAALQTYQHGLRTQAQQTVILVSDALQLAGDAIDRVLTGFGVETNLVKPNVDQALAQLKTNVDQLIFSKNGEIRINGSKVHTKDGKFEREFEQQMENAMMQLTGAVMMSVGQSMLQGEGSFEQRMELFGQKMDQFGSDIEREMEQRGDQLELQGEKICLALHELEKQETAIQKAIPAMQDYDLIQIEMSKTAAN